MSAVLPLQNGSIIRNSASLLAFSTPYPRGLQRHFGTEQDFHCGCAVGLAEYSSAIIDLEGGMAGVRRINLKSPLAELTIEASLHIRMES